MELSFKLEDNVIISKIVRERCKSSLRDSDTKEDLQKKEADRLFDWFISSLMVKFTSSQKKMNLTKNSYEELSFVITKDKNILKCENVNFPLVYHFSDEDLNIEELLNEVKLKFDACNNINEKSLISMKFNQLTKEETKLFRFDRINISIYITES